MFCFPYIRQSCEIFIELNYILTRKILMFAMRINVCSWLLVVQLRQTITFFDLNVRFC